MMKLLIIGHARHGKDTVAEAICELYGMTMHDSSTKALEIFLYDKLKAKYGYSSMEEAYQDRVNHRAEWFDEITAYNTPDKTRLAREILSDSDIYVGMRNSEEIEACLAAGVFDAVIWVDASERKPPEPSNSFDIDESYADLIIDNNGPEWQLGLSVVTAMEELKMSNEVFIRMFKRAIS